MCLAGRVRIHVCSGKRVVTAPRKQPKKKGARKHKRGLGCAAKRSRARFDAKAYVARKRVKARRSGPANPFVVRTDPRIFHKDPRGRKPLSYQVRMEDVPEAEQIMEDAIRLEEEKNSGSKQNTKKGKKKKKKKSKSSATHYMIDYTWQTIWLVDDYASQTRETIS